MDTLAVRLIASGVAAFVGFLSSASWMYFRGIRNKVSREEVRQMLLEQPLQAEVKALAANHDRDSQTLERIREEVSGLRSDISRLSATLEMLLRSK